MTCSLCPDIPPAYLKDFCHDLSMRRLRCDPEPYGWLVGDTWLWLKEGKWTKEGVPVDQQEIRSLLQQNGGRFIPYTG